VAEGDDAEDHGEHLARDGDGDEQHRREGRERVDCCGVSQSTTTTSSFSHSCPNVDRTEEGMGAGEQRGE
jgi:hypothetical protein